MPQDFLHGVDVVEIDDQIRPIRTAKTSVIGLIGTAGTGPVNVPTLVINNLREAESLFGPNRANGFTIPSALAAIFAQGPATVVVNNVFDASLNTNRATNDPDVTLNGNTAILPNQHLVEDLLTVGNTIVAPYTVTNLGSDRAFTAVANNGNGKIKLTVADGNNYTVGQQVTISQSTVAAYNGTFTVLAKSAGFLEVDRAFSNTAVGSVSAPAADRVSLHVGCVLTSINHFTSNAVLQAKDLVIGQKVKITYTATLVRGVDYDVNWVYGTLTRKANSKLLVGATLSMDYTYLDGTVDQTVSIIGTIEAGNYTGIQAMRVAKANTFVNPRILIAPGFTHQKPTTALRSPVVDTLAQVADALKAIAIIDCPNTTREDAVAHRADFDSNRLYFHAGFYKVLRPGTAGVYDDVPASPYLAGIISSVDNAQEMGFWWSPSNKQVKGIAGLSKKWSHSLSSNSETDSNYLNTHYVTCTVAAEAGGYVTWGNYMAGGQFITTRRITDMIHESVVMAHAWAVDRPINKGLVRVIVSGVHEYLARLERQGAIIGGSAWADPELNAPAEINLGNLTIDFDFTDPKPAQHIKFRSHLVDKYTSRIFDEVNQPSVVTV